MIIEDGIKKYLEDNKHKLEKEEILILKQRPAFLQDLIEDVFNMMS